MSAAVLLAIIVASGEAQSPMTRAMVATSSEALGPQVTIAVHETPVPSDVEAARVEATDAPSAVAELSWLDAAHVRARLRVHVPRTGRWIDRTIVFAAADSLYERGRALGFSLAAMLPEADPTLSISPAVAAPAPPTVLPKDLSPRRSLGLFAVATDDFAGPTRGLGGAANAALGLRDSAAMHLALSLWRGSIPGLASSALTAQVAAGASWTPLRLLSSRRLGVGVEADALIAYQGVSHEDAAGKTARKSKLSPGADVMVDGAWRVARNLEVVVTAGSEILFGSVDVVVVSATSTKQVTLPPVRAVTEAGLRLLF